MKDMIWISTSLFCCKSQWNKLFANGIIPFVTNNLLDAYTIEFNYLNGENVRFSMLTAETNAPTIANHADEHFKKYFLNSNLFASEIRLPTGEIFMSFPSNIIRYGLYPPQKIAPNEKRKYSFPIELSQIILNALKDDVIDDETILTLSIYLQIGLIKVINNFHPGFISRFRPLILKDRAQTHISDTSVLRTKFENTKHIFIEIANDVMDNTSEVDNPGWLEKWCNICEIEINKTSGKSKAETIYQEMLFTVHKHLGIPVQVKTTLSYFIEQVLLYRDYTNGLTKNIR